MKNLRSFFFSMFFTGILLVIFAVAIAYATFVENDYGTTTAKILIYNSKWFELLLVILCINLIGSIFQYKMVTKKKWPMFLFHVSFVVIIIGAGVTRYYGYEGSMHIREGFESNAIVSTESFVTIKASNGNYAVQKDKEVKFSVYTANRYSEKFNINGQTIHVKNLQYIQSAKETLIPDPMGEPVISMIAAGSNMRSIEFNLKTGDSKNINEITLGFGSTKNTDVKFHFSNGKLFMIANKMMTLSDGTQQGAEIVPAETTTEIVTQRIYTIGEVSFAVQQYLLKGKTQLVYGQSQNEAGANDALRTQVTVGNESKELVVFGKKGLIGIPYNINIGGIDVSITYGSKLIELPFSLYLNDFQLERYPGSNSPSSYASEVVLKDGALEQPYRIFMNNILKYKGYRFFQSSYDNDEKGTILSVNHDALGTGITYFGYFIMAFGMLLTLFNKSSRFKKLIKASGKLRKDRKKYFAVVLLGIMFSFTASAQTTKIKKDHIAEFEELIIQSQKGRIEPVSTMASQILRKVAKKTKWDGMSPTAVFLDMHANPEKWKNIAIIKVGNAELRKQLGIYNGKYATFNTIVAPREMGGYKLSNMVQQAYGKSTNQRNKFDKEVIYVDERVNILMNVFSGNYLEVFPIPGDNNNKWVSIRELQLLPKEMINFASQTMANYLGSVNKGDWATASSLLNAIKENQKKYGAEVIPSPTKIKLEIFYNNINIFGKLSKIFLFSGLILLILQLTTVFNPSIRFRIIKNIAFYYILVLFIIETGGLAIRWYISGHAPWSNGYESMIFISWATCLGGLLFVKRSEITLSMTTLLSGLTLMVAGMSWMSPEITNLVPVLKSYWLIVHVAIITASYGFLGISALLGLLNLLLMIFRSKSTLEQINYTIQELVYIIKIALIIGLLLLTVGSFLGGVWANESWGRYWGWDPKETWALVTVLVYTFITHMHKIQGLKNNFAMSVAALVGFSSVLMTYFGVNYYLSGLHSYAQGEAAPVPMGVYIAVALVFVIIGMAYVSNKNLKEQPGIINELEE